MCYSSGLALGMSLGSIDLSGLPHYDIPNWVFWILFAVMAANCIYMIHLSWPFASRFKWAANVSLALGCAMALILFYVMARTIKEAI